MAFSLNKRHVTECFVFDTDSFGDVLMPCDHRGMNSSFEMVLRRQNSSHYVLKHDFHSSPCSWTSHNVEIVCSWWGMFVFVNGTHCLSLQQHWVLMICNLFSTSVFKTRRDRTWSILFSILRSTMWFNHAKFCCLEVHVIKKSICFYQCQLH